MENKALIVIIFKMENILFNIYFIAETLYENKKEESKLSVTYINTCT